MELCEDPQFNNHQGLGTFPFAILTFSSFVDSFVSATPGGRNLEVSQPSAAWL